MKIEPMEEYDQEVFSFLKEIKHQLKQKESNEISYSVYYSPHNKNFYKTQFLIDKLAKKGVFKVIDCYEVKCGTNPDFRSVNFVLKVIPLVFNRFYAQYKKAFELSRNTKLVIYKNGEAELIANGNTHKTKFNSGSDSFSVLMLLAKNKDNLVSFSEIAETMKEKPSKDTTDERRARDVIQYIKSKKFGYKGTDFIQTAFSFRLVCDVEIKS